ncbi:MAG: hypothetical protein O3C57_06770, partial [Verrucomicrobia bacterium]|nr:hypothetical protein [Verrucomicrobiota bacterium]
MNNKNAFDFWYAVNNTEILVMPERHLETFGVTILNYFLVAELMDSIGQTRIREGRMQAAQPQIITPQSYSQTMLEGFGEEAAKYVQWLKSQESNVKILQYGYTLKQESFSEHIVSRSKEVVIEEIRENVRKKNDPLSAVVDGVDDPWDVCLIKLFWEVVQQSAHTNIQQLAKRNLFDDAGGVPRGLREEIEKGFLEASRDASKIELLGKKLQKCGLFDDYQDRFF